MTTAASRKRGLSKGARTRATLKDAALGLYAQSGWSGVTVDDICKATGLTVGAFYFHFDSKDALLDEMADEASRDYHADVVDLINWRNDLFEVFYSLIEYYYRSYVSNPVKTRLIYTVIMQQSVANVAWRANREVLRARLETAIAAARAPEDDRGAGPSAAFTSHWLLSSLEDFLWSVFMAKEDSDLVRLAAGPDVFVRRQAILWYRSVLGQDPDHPLARLARPKTLTRDLKS